MIAKPPYEQVKQRDNNSNKQLVRNPESESIMDCALADIVLKKYAQYA